VKKRLLLAFVVLIILCPSSIVPRVSASPHARAQSTPIQHIILITKENHTFDSLFGTFPGANGATTGVVKVNGVDHTIPLNPPQNVTSLFCHVWSCALKADDHGKMDAFNLADAKYCGSPPYACYQTGNQALIPNYWQLASHFVLDDNGWSSLRGASFPNHLMLMSAGSGVDIPHSVIQGPNSGNSWGCDTVSTARATLYNGSKVFPCFTFSTLADEMQRAGVSWTYYSPQQGQSGYNWNAPDYYNQLRNNPAIWTTHDLPEQQFLSDAATGSLPAFSWVSPSKETSEHNGYSECVGENATIAQINAVESGPDWASTVIVVTWDDWGGLYDHVAPQNVDALGYGFRVPFLVISPYAYAGDNLANTHISHDQLEFSSVLRLAEEAFNLPSLGRRDTTARDLLPLLDFSQVHNAPLLLQQRTCPASHITPVQEIDD
jgi:phospholipase C